MRKRKLGIGSISLLLVLIAFFWAYDINEFCLGDNILKVLKLPAWSDSVSSTGTHYTPYYTFIFLIPAFILSIKYNKDLFAKAGKWLSILFMSLLIFGLLIMV